MVMDQLTGLGWGIITLGVMIGVGIVLLTTMGANVATTSPSANATIQAIAGYLGTTNGGLASWIPLIIVLVIGLFFLGAFMVKRGKSA